ncbi:hypothetical protein PP175_09590 [Aneurinibacillus sp. Ricciae_BoGa-3]|uniref:hypothetical protein n=1 Tax=Aneurinibacillus sp. Ricciae_BoGa-3 TaxID=3022697 RepID=UPI002340B664|nr:hypothetical protein [Aneurinibacillus sp. Ricciae_BoGa-3]WCK56134.1 hypothetical protein PP175_09590 [Aneurinibacillus sp. Ricciae_BoGa-3]
MWKCHYCGSEDGMPYKDRNLSGMLCLAPDCGRFNEIMNEIGTESAGAQAGIGPAE